MYRLFSTTLILVAAALTLACQDCSESEPSPATDDTSFDSVDQWLAERAHSLEEIDNLDPLVDAAADRRLALLGESTHGTRQFYDWRADITIALAERQRIDFVAVEGDWHAARAADRWVMGETDEDLDDLLADAFDRWPRWMWANEQFADFLRRLREHNADHPDHPVRIYGMDMQDFFTSLDRLVDRLESERPEEADEIVEHLDCLGGFAPSAGRYTRHIQAEATPGCADEIATAVDRIRTWYDGDDTDDLSMRKHARVVESGEAQYRKRHTGEPAAFWNVRATHMFEAVEGMLDAHGPESRGVVWAHNTHVGDARATDMKDRNRVNIGQLGREHFGEDDVFALGFSTRQGGVVAASDHGATPRKMELPRAPEDTVDEQFDRIDTSPYLVFFDADDTDRSWWTKRPGQRAVGIVYHPEREYPGNYVPTNPAARYDALLFIDETNPLEPFEHR